MSSENLQTKCLMTSRKIRAVSISVTSTSPSKLKSNKERNPLATLCVSNQPLPQNEAQNSRKKRTSSTNVKAIRTSSVSSVKSRSKSTSGSVNNVNTALITVQAVSSTKESDDEDEVFVPGETHYINYVSQEQRVEYVPKIGASKETKMVQTLPVVRVSGDFSQKNAEAKPAVKVTLAKKLGRRFSRFRMNFEDFYTNSLYDDEYVEDNYKYILRTEGKCVYRKSFLRKYIDFGSRLVLVNWLVYIHQVLEYSESTLFITIRMLDAVLIKSKISTKEYALVAITCMWIASKAHESSVASVHKLITLSNRKFSKCQFISMEREILKILNFQVVFPEPSAFLYYYLKKANFEGNPKILFASMFLLEVFTMVVDFSATGPSVLAASALYLVLQKYDMDYAPFADFIDSHLLQANVFKKFCESMAVCVQSVVKCNAIKSNEVVAKYSVQEKLNVAQNFLQ